MEFKSQEELLLFLRSLKEIGFGSQGICYYNPKDKKVYKIFHQFFDNDEDTDFAVRYVEGEILRFSHIENNTFIWPKETIFVNGEVVGYITPYINAKSLYKINPLRVNLDTFNKAIINAKKDIDLISDHKIVTMDMMYNMLYNKSFSIIDEDDYTYLRDESDIELNRKINHNNFDMEIYYFLADGIFENFINSHSDLKELYGSKKENVLVFLKLFRKYLSEMFDKEITCLGEARCCMNKRLIINKYQREL